MAKRVKIELGSVTVGGGPAFVTNTEDGPVTTWDWFVQVAARDDGGRMATLTYKAGLAKDVATRLANRVEAAGMIDPAFWTLTDPWESVMGDRSMEVRFGSFGAEWEREMMERSNREA